MTAASPTVSVLVLAYNHERYIAPCIQSLLAIDYPDFEIILLDDGSTDGTLAIARSFVAAASRPMTIASQPHSGCVSLNSQKLLQMGRGKYLLFMASDDALAPGFTLQRTVAALDADERVTMAFSRALHVTMGNCANTTSIYTPAFRALLHTGDPDRIYHEHLCQMVSRLFLQGTLVRKSFIDEFGGFDTTLIADDYAFMVRAFQAMLRRQKRIIFDEDNIWLYRLHEVNIHKDATRQLDLVYEVVTKYIPRECWPTFTIDYPRVESFDGFRAYCAQLRRWFGPAAEPKMIPTLARTYAKRLLREQDAAALWRLLSWKGTPRKTWFYALPRLHKLIG